MRLWSLHPGCLDRAGLLALWREALLAQAVLQGKTRGYGHHPQLSRFRTHPDPEAAIAAYLEAVLSEAGRRGYRFAAGKIGGRRSQEPLTVTAGQVAFEAAHLLAKLRRRDPARAEALAAAGTPELHPLFRLVAGDREAWEKGPAALPEGGADGRRKGPSALPRGQGRPGRRDQ